METRITNECIVWGELPNCGKGANGPFRVRELAEIWFGTERTTEKEEEWFRLILSTVWQTLFVQDRRSRDLFHLRPSV